MPLHHSKHCSKLPCLSLLTLQSNTLKTAVGKTLIEFLVHTNTVGTQKMVSQLNIVFQRGKKAFMRNKSSLPSHLHLFVHQFCEVWLRKSWYSCIMALSKVLLHFLPKLGFLNEALYNTGVMEAFESNLGFRLRNSKIKI